MRTSSGWYRWPHFFHRGDSCHVVFDFQKKGKVESQLPIFRSLSGHDYLLKTWKHGLNGISCRDCMTTRVLVPPLVRWMPGRSNWLAWWVGKWRDLWAEQVLNSVDFLGGCPVSLRRKVLWHKMEESQIECLLIVSNVKANFEVICEISTQSWWQASVSISGVKKNESPSIFETFLFHHF